MARKGFPVHRQNLILSVEKVIEATGRETKYLLNGTPGRSWFQGFLRRHPKIKQKYAESRVPQVGRSDSGWITSAVFYEDICNHFLPYLKSHNIQKPVIAFVDGHRSHLTKEVNQLRDKIGVILISLLPNTTHIRQPADVSMFRPLKAGWVSEVRNWKFENFPKDVTRSTFGTILKFVFDKLTSEKTIRNGFRKIGLYPFNKNNVDYPQGDFCGNYPEK
ncbi:hypothetical protein ILUMI_05553 [Ignelater luminosus]|uniref:DDE-1 domain-containing protein n=1 Tax=Ignelater luminosus TaxID=2038154 RepID=A0A8K0DHG6_IGNLU|nr:hypothetical protein ILUMI_05553 [Ignelater luminosus]